MNIDTYDHVAETYARTIGGDLAGKPLDRALLDCFGEVSALIGPICDLGCGPGQVAGYLKSLGHEVLGVDLSAGMLVEARRLHPGIPFQLGDMRQLPLADGCLGGVVAFYSLIHLERPELPRALAEIERVLRPGGRVLVAFHVGQGTEHLDEWWGQPVDLDFHYFTPDEMQAGLAQAGLALEYVTVRNPYAPEVEHQSQRAYLMARKPPRRE